MERKQESKRGFTTNAIRHQATRSGFAEHSVPIYATSSYVFEDAEDARAHFAGEVAGPIYSRYSNPNTDEFVDKLATMEGAEDGLALASGMAAMFASIAGLLSTGDHIVASRFIFGSTHQILTRVLPRWGISHSYVDLGDPQAWERAIRPETKMIFVETPSNPGLEIIDLEFLGRVASDHGILLVVDNCFATPYLQRPLSLGAHLVTHSATKFIDGQGRTIAGAILGGTDVIEDLRFFVRHTGPALSPFHGWLLSKSLETLSLRMERHCDNAEALTAYLKEHPKVTRVSYPHDPDHTGYEVAKRQMRRGGGLVSFEIAGGIDAGRRFLDGLRMLSLTANLGDSRSIATHPASTTHSKLTEEERLAVGISPGFIRISVGLEDTDDILADVQRALDEV